MRRSSIPLATVSMLVFLFCGVMSAQQSTEPLNATMAAHKIVIRDGSEIKQPAETAKPGDMIEYTVEYRNQSAGVLRGVRAVLPIPLGMGYESGSAVPKDFAASIDGKTFSAVPLKRRQKNADGSETEVLVPLREYRALRWELGDIAANSSKNVQARVRVLSSTAAAEPTKH